MIAEKVFEKCIKGIEIVSRDKSLDDYLDSLDSDIKIRPKVSSILFTYYRKKLSIEFIIDHFARKKSKTRVLNILSVAITQILFQHSIENEVAVYVAVNYSKRRLGKGPSGFINAILRKVVSNLNNIEEILNNASFYIKNDIPEFVYSRWNKFYSSDEIESLIRIIKTPEKYIYFRRIGNNRIDLIENAEPVSMEKFKTNFKFYKTENSLQVIKSDALINGLIYIQDPATSMAVSSINYIGKGKILDGCSAPGGKTLMLAELFPDSVIIAADRSDRRLERVKKNIEKAGFKNVKAIFNDMMNPIFKKKEFDVVFLDVPCSNSGVLRKRPDVLWKLSEDYIASIITLQKQILSSAKELVRPGGKLVYSTCSIEYDENEGLIKKFLDLNHDFYIDFQKQLLPDEINDGAFVAVMNKK